MWLYVVLLVASWLFLRFFNNDNNNTQRDEHQTILDTQHTNKTTDDMSLCANCGKGEECSGDLKSCTACKLVKYCNRDCQIAHRPQHKKTCKKRASELHDEALFREPPHPHGDCPICLLRLPTMDSGKMYMECCGKIICTGCFHADVYDNLGNIIVEKMCPFCRTPNPTSGEEVIKRLKKRMEVGDEYAFFMMGTYYYGGEYDLPQDSSKAVKFWRKATKLGSAMAYNNIGSAYANGQCVERDAKMASHYFELAAMKGCVPARYNLGVDEYNAGNYDRALKHYMIAVRGGHTQSVKVIQQLYMNGHVAKDHYANALRSHQAYLNEVKSGQRDKAAAFCDDYRYY